MPVPLTEEETKNRQLALLKYLSKQGKPIPEGYMGFTITPEMQASIDQAVAQAQAQNTSPTVDTTPAETTPTVDTTPAVTSNVATQTGQTIGTPFGDITIPPGGFGGGATDTTTTDDTTTTTTDDTTTTTTDDTTTTTPDDTTTTTPDDTTTTTTEDDTTKNTTPNFVETSRVENPDGTFTITETDTNPDSPTAGQIKTRTEGTPKNREPNFVEIGRTEPNPTTGKYIVTLRDMNPNSPSYNRTITREEQGPIPKKDETDLPVYDPIQNPEIGWDKDYSGYYEARGINRFQPDPNTDPVPTTLDDLRNMGARRAYLPMLAGTFRRNPKTGAIIGGDGGNPAIPVYAVFQQGGQGLVPSFAMVYDTQGYLLSKGGNAMGFTPQDFTYLENSEIPEDDPGKIPSPDLPTPPITDTFDPTQFSAQQITDPTLPKGTEFEYTPQQFGLDETMTLPEGARLDPELMSKLAQGTATTADLPVVKRANTYTADQIYNDISRFAGENNVVDREVVAQLGEPSLKALVLNEAADEIIARNPNTYTVDADELPSRRGMISDQPVQILGANGQVIGVIPAGAEIPTVATIQALGSEALNVIDRPQSQFVADETAAQRAQEDVTERERVAATQGGQILERALGKDTSDLSPTELALAPAVEQVSGIVEELFPQAVEGNVQALDTVRGQLSLLMEDFNDGTPDWAAGSIRAANQIMAERGLANSSIAAATIVQAAQEAALPIAQADAQVYANMNLTNLANKNKFALDNAAAARNFKLQDLSNAQQTELANSAQRYALLSATLSNYQAAMLANAQMQNALQEQDLSRGQQEQVVNAARYAELENMNLTNEQQTRITNQANNLQVDMANLSVKEKAILAELQVQAALEGQELNNTQQTNIIKASRYAEAGNLDFTAEQNRVFQNSKMMETLSIDNLEFDQLRTLQNAANFAQMDTQNLNNRQLAQVENAKNFLSMNLANLTNDQQSTVLYSQQLQQGLLSDQAAENAARQFNATSQNQVDQFFDNLIADINKHNTAQMNAMEQYNVGQKNALNQYNTTLRNQREQFNAKNALEIEQSNVQYRRELNTLNTAGINAQNQVNVANRLEISNQALSDIWQEYRDQASYAYNAGQSKLDREFNLVLATMQADLQKYFFDAELDYNTASGIWDFAASIVKDWMGGKKKDDDKKPK